MRKRIALWLVMSLVIKIEGYSAEGQKVELKIQIPKLICTVYPPPIPNGANIDPALIRMPIYPSAKGVIPQPTAIENRRPPFFVPKGFDSLLSIGKKVTSNDMTPTIGSLDQVTDGIKQDELEFVVLNGTNKWIQIDLLEPFSISAIIIWRHITYRRIYRNVVVQIGNDNDFKNSFTLFNSDTNNILGLGIGKDYEYIETEEGKLIDAKCIKARYVRLHSNGNYSNNDNHYLEVEVYGKGKETNPPSKQAESETQIINNKNTN